MQSTKRFDRWTQTSVPKEGRVISPVNARPHPVSHFESSFGVLRRKPLLRRAAQQAQSFVK